MGEAVDKRGMGEDEGDNEDKHVMDEGEGKDKHGMNVDKGDTEFVKVKRSEVELDAAGWPSGIDKDTGGETRRVVTGPSTRHRWRHR